MLGQRDPRVQQESFITANHTFQIALLRVSLRFRSRQRRRDGDSPLSERTTRGMAPPPEFFQDSEILSRTPPVHEFATSKSPLTRRSPHRLTTETGRRLVTAAGYN